MTRDRFALSAVGTRRLAPGEFFGGARLSHSSHGFDISHRIAEGDPESVPIHTHQDAHFILVSGGDYVSAAGRRPPAGEPVLVYNPPGTTHRDHFERGRGSYFAISLAPGCAALALSGTSAPDEPRYLTGPKQHALAIQIARGCAADPEALTVEASCLELLDSTRRAAPAGGSAPPPWLHQALELLHDRYAEDLSIAEIARGVGVHPIHLARVFRRHFHCTPGVFARHRRLERAVALLMSTRSSLSEVALSCGFADQSHLTRVFARTFGLPPGEYRSLTAPGAGPTPRFQIDKTRTSEWSRVSAWAASARARARRL